jgi:hypothetical protein
MGTSGAYGGSNAKRWRDFREAWDGFGSGDGSPSTPPKSPPDAPPPKDPPPELDLSLPPNPGLDLLGEALLNALGRDDRLSRHVNAPTLSLSSLLARRLAPSGDGRSGSGGATGTTGSPGRAGARASRRVINGAGRGGAVLGAAYALRERDGAALADYGLSLAELDGLGPRGQAVKIVALILGDDGHPDEAALRQAATQQVKRILTEGTEVAPVDAIRGLVGELIFRLGLTELKDQINAGTLDGKQAAVRERSLRGWIAAKLRALPVGTSGKVTRAELHQATADLAHKALRILRAR